MVPVLIKKLEQNGQITTLCTQAAESLLETRLRCHMCTYFPHNLPDLKRHIANSHFLPGSFQNESLLETPLQCHMCTYFPHNLPDLKKHLKNSHFLPGSFQNEYLLETPLRCHMCKVGRCPTQPSQPQEADWLLSLSTSPFLE